MKNRIIRTILSSLLIVVMLFTAVPITASATTSGKCGDNLTWTFNQSTGELVISGEGEMYNERSWESYTDTIKSVTIGNGVTTIGDYVFWECINLTEITIPNTVTYIGNCAFCECDWLSDVYYSGTSEQWEQIYIDPYGDGNGNIPLKRANIHFLSDPISTVCGGNLTWSFNETTGELSITGTGAMYDYALNNRPWESYEDNIKSITIGNSVTSIGYAAFSDCSSLTSVTIGNSVTWIGSLAFEYCESLKGVDIGDSVATIGAGAFSDCSSLTSVTIPDSVATIGDYAFSCCNSLTSVTIPDSVTTIGEGAFYGCDRLMSMNVDSDNQYYSSDAYGVLYNKDKTTLIQYPCGNARTSFIIPNSVTTIGDDAFFPCEYLTSIGIPDSVTTIEDYAFFGCISLTSVDIPNSVTTIGEGAFSNCESLTSIDIPNFVTTIGDWAFSDCCSLTSVTIPDSVITIGAYAFADCNSLTSVDIPNSVTTIGEGAFAICYSLTDVYYSGTQEQWDAVSISSYNEDLTSANIHFECDVESPVLEVYQVSEEGDILTVNIDLTSNSFNSLDVVFNMKGLKCTDIKQGATIIADHGITLYPNPKAPAGKSHISVIALEGVETGTIAVVTLEIIDERYSFSIEVPDCAITREKDGKKENVTVEPEIYGVVSGERTDEPETYTITYNANGGSNAPAPQTKTEDVNITLSKSTPTRSGYTFLGWSTNKNATVAQYKPGATFSTNANTTLYAVWSKEEIYNLGEETYSFDNFGDSDSPGGHCFGMSITSSGYYLNELDIKDIGLNSSSELYTASETAKVKKPICHYQDIQGTYSRDAIVAGGTSYKYGYYNISSDWNAVVNYVKNHHYDGTGALQIGLRKSSQGGHAVNFLRYENVNGEDRIYAYDNNFPNTETYFYKGSDGKVYQKPYSTFSGAIDCIALRSVAKYFDLAGDFDSSRVIYGWADTIEIEGVTGYPMELGGSGEYMMYEIPDGVDEVVIVPLTDNATFEYMDEGYQFGGINDETYGVFTLSTSENASDENFVIENEQNSVDEVFVYDLDMTYKSYAFIETEIYVTGNTNYTVEYSSSNPSVAYVDEFGEVYAAGEGSAEITCAVTDEYGNVVTDTCKVKVSYALWQWIIRILLLGFLWY